MAKCIVVPSGLDGDEAISCLQYQSEFDEKGYDRADFVISLAASLSISSSNNNGQEIITDYLSRSSKFFQKHLVSARNNLKRESKKIYDEQLEMPEIEFDVDSENEEPYVDRFYVDFANNRKRLYESLNYESWNTETVWSCFNQYIQSYFAIMQKVVFSPNNYHLNNLAFRRSKYLQELVQFSIVGNKSNFEKSKDKCRFSYLDPFAMDVFLRSIEGARLLDEALPTPKKRRLVDKLRIDLYLTSVQSAFSRYAFLNGQTYRVQLNRHTSELLAIPYNQISSVEEIKPIRLFEKIASYIRKQADKTRAPDVDNINVSACVLGHSECSGNGQVGKEAGVEDLVFLVLRWYRQLHLPGGKPRLNFILTNYVNERDCTGMRFREAVEESRDKQDRHTRHHNRWEIEGHRAEYSIIASDFSKYLFTAKYLKTHIDDNDLIFILDCPWMTAENYELKRDGSLKSFCQVLSDYQYSTKVNRSQFLSQFQYFYKSSMMRRVDGQLGRIMGSDTGTAGQVVRVLKEPVLKKIGSFLKQKKEHDPSSRETIVYLFTSEKDGIDLASVASDPLTRTEKYDGKTFTIVKYSNHETVPLRTEAQEGVCFRISLWSIIKYISAPFAYLDLRASLLDRLCFKSADFREMVDVLGIYRSIFVRCDLDNSLQNVTCSIRASDGLRACLPVREDQEFEEMKWAILAWARTLIEPLYREVVFANAENRKATYGDDAIRTAFLMNLYSSANDVQTMLFWHQYRMLEKSGHCGLIKCDFLRTVATKLDKLRDLEFTHGDFFSDKKLYDSVLYSLERSASFSIAMERMFAKADRLFSSTPEDMHFHTATRVLRNIIHVCELHEKGNSTVCINARKALLEYK